MGFFGGVQYYSEDIKHRINNLSHLLEWNMQDISLSGYIFTRLRLVKNLAIFHSDSCNKYYICGYPWLYIGLFVVICGDIGLSYPWL